MPLLNNEKIYNRIKKNFSHKMTSNREILTKDKGKKRIFTAFWPAGLPGRGNSIRPNR